MNLLEKISQKIDKKADAFRSYREYFHQNPELSWEEYKTSAFIKEKLDEWGISYKSVGGTGIVCELGNSLPIIAYRADLDALPIQDEKKCDYSSKNENVCHACGHDFHTATALSTIETLKDFQDEIKGTIRFIFEPAEEVTPGGAEKLIKENVLKNVDRIYAMHAEPALEFGKIGIVRGWVTTQSVTYKISIKGRGGHSARPFNATDPIFFGTAMTQQLYAALDRMNRYDKFFVFTMTTFHSGTKANVIPDEAVLEASLRLTVPEKLEEIKGFIDQFIYDQAKIYGIEVKIEHIIGDPPVVNDINLANRAEKILTPLFKQENIFENTKTMGGEDFSNYLQVIPGLYIRFGISEDLENQFGLHNPRFDIHKDSVVLATKMFSHLLLEEMLIK
jgi:amidohydrolase